MSQSSEEYEQGLQALSNYLSRVLAADAPDSDRSLLFFIRRKLLQYNLEESFTIDDILHEAFIRTQKTIQNGKAIQSIPAWMNRVCFNIIREKNRECRSRQNLDQQLRLELSTDDDIESFFEVSIDKIGVLLSAWESLKESDQEILTLKYIEKRSWKEIATRISKSESKKISEQAIRKRGERALSRLRESFNKSILHSNSNSQQSRK